jgi:hypothetical protein
MRRPGVYGPAAGAVPVSFPRAVAYPTFIGDGVAQKIMRAGRFEPIAYSRYILRLQRVHTKCEYFSLDTQARQTMNERRLGVSSVTSASAAINPYLGMLVAPQ